MRKELFEYIKNDWGITITLQDSEYYAELETFSDAGEDFIITVWFDGTDEDFIKQFKKCAEDFDADEHAATWYGQNRGEPNSLRALLDDAEDMKKFMITCADAYQRFYDANADEEYEQYKLNWMLEHGHTLKDLINQLDALAVANNDFEEDSDIPAGTIKKLFDEWESEYGFNGTLWACKKEWLDSSKH